MLATVLAPALSSANLTSIDKRSNLAQHELRAEYIEPGLPVVLTDATSQWGARQKFTPEFFKQHYGALSKEIKSQTYTVAEMAGLMRTSTPEHPAPYPFNLNIEQFFPELPEDRKPEIVFGKSDRIKHPLLPAGDRKAHQAPRQSDRIKHPLLPKLMLRATQVYELFLGGNGGRFPYLYAG